MVMKERWEILADLCNKINAKQAAEIGVSRGINAGNWLKLCPNLFLHLVDKDNSVFDLGQFIHDSPNDNYIYYNYPSEEAVKQLPDNLDLIFIDAGHGYDEVLKDIKNYLPKIRKDGILCGHDYTLEKNPHTEVKIAVDKCVQEGLLQNPINIEQDTLEEGKIYIWWTII